MFLLFDLFRDVDPKNIFRHCTKGQVLCIYMIPYMSPGKMGKRKESWQRHRQPMGQREASRGSLIYGTYFK